MMMERKPRQKKAATSRSSCTLPSELPNAWLLQKPCLVAHSVVSSEGHMFLFCFVSVGILCCPPCKLEVNTFRFSQSLRLFVTLILMMG